MEGICDIDKERLATRAVLVRHGSDEMELELCEYHYNQLRMQQQGLEPDQVPANSAEDSFSEFVSQLGLSPEEESASPHIKQLVNDSAKQSILEAAQTAVAFGRRELNTEHLLYALTATKSVQKLLSTGRKAKKIREQIDARAFKTDRPANQNEPIELTVSPHFRHIFDTAVRASHDLGDSYVGPVHLLIGVAQEPEGVGGAVLRSNGLTAKTLRQKTKQYARDKL